MSCPRCGSKIPSEARRCPNCGTVLQQGVWKNIARLFSGNGHKSAPRSSRHHVATGPCSFRVSAVAYVEGRGVVVTGDMEEGHLRPGDQVALTDTAGNDRLIRVTEIQQSKKSIVEARAGDTVELFLTDIRVEDIASGTLLRH